MYIGLLSCYLPTSTGHLDLMMHVSSALKGAMYNFQNSFSSRCVFIHQATCFFLWTYMKILDIAFAQGVICFIRFGIWCIHNLIGYKSWNQLQCRDKKGMLHFKNICLIFKFLFENWYSQCNLSVFNPEHKFHGLFNLYGLSILRHLRISQKTFLL